MPRETGNHKRLERKYSRRQYSLSLLWLTALIAEFMLPVLRSALLLCAALGATIVAPAQADPSGEPLTPVTTASLPEVSVHDLIDPNGSVLLSGPGSENSAADPADEADVAPIQHN